MGIYSACLIVMTYMNYAQLGVLNAYNRDYPQALGRKDFNEANKQRNITVTFMLLVYTIILIAFEAWVFLNYRGQIGINQKSTYYAFGYALCPVMILLKSFDDMANSTVRMQGKYNKSALLGFIRTVLAFGIGALFIKIFGYYGLYAMSIASALIGIIFFYNDSFKGTKLDLDFNYMKLMVVGGLPLLINSLIWTIVQNVDKHVIQLFFKDPDNALGVYSVPTMGFTTMVLVPQTISQVFYIKISHLYGANHDEKELLDKAGYFTCLTSAISGIACVMVFYIMPIFVGIFMPRYTDGNVATQILIIGVAIYSTTMLFGNIFSVVKLNKSLIANSVALCIFNMIFSSALVLLVERSINMVAIGTGLSYALYSLLLMIKLSKKFSYSFLKLFANSWLPVLAMVIPGVLFYLIIPNIYIAAAFTLFTILVVCAILLKLRIRERG